MSNAIAAHKHRTKLHVLRDRVKRALRDQKRGIVGTAERVKAHQAQRAAYRAAHPCQRHLAAQYGPAQLIWQSSATVSRQQACGPDPILRQRC